MRPPFVGFRGRSELSIPVSRSPEYGSGDRASYFPFREIYLLMIYVYFWESTSIIYTIILTSYRLCSKAIKAIKNNWFNGPLIGDEVTIESIFFYMSDISLKHNL